jgi:hypothetical protein
MENHCVPRTAMAALPTGSSNPAPAPNSAAEPAWLQGELRSRVELAAAHAGLGVAEACEQLLRQGLEQAERQRALSEAAGRCSLRTGTSSLGPVPLPVQQ